MKCALELQMIATVRAEKLLEEENARREAAHQAIVAETLAFCEKLGQDLEKLAEKGKFPKLEFMSSSDLNQVLVPTYRDYADHRESYTPSGNFNFEVLKNWFAEYCFEVQLHKTYGWRYFWGEISMYRVIISPKAECL